MFSSALFASIYTASVTKVYCEVKLTLSSASFTKIDTVSVTILDVNIESKFLVTLDNKVNVKAFYMLVE